jgi:mono/diheme cytochrome c family protein
MIHTPRLLISLALPLVGVALITACQTARRSEPLTAISPTPEDPALRAGHIAFMQHCHECHPNGATAVGPALNDKPLPPPLIKTQIRVGMGKMPAFSKEKLPDDRMDALVDYLVWLRRSHPAPDTVTQ